MEVNQIRKKLFKLILLFFVLASCNGPKAIFKNVNQWFDKEEVFAQIYLDAKNKSIPNLNQ